MTRCLSCGYLNHAMALNCPKCGSFYTKFVADEKAIEMQKASGIIDKIKKQIRPPHSSRRAL